VSRLAVNLARALGPASAGAGGGVVSEVRLSLDVDRDGAGTVSRIVEVVPTLWDVGQDVVMPGPCGPRVPHRLGVDAPRQGRPRPSYGAQVPRIAPSGVPGTLEANEHLPAGSGEDRTIDALVWSGRGCDGPDSGPAVRGEVRRRTRVPRDLVGHAATARADEREQGDKTKKDPGTHARMLSEGVGDE